MIKLLYISPEFPHRRHGFEAVELQELSKKAELHVISLRRPASGARHWLTNGFDLRHVKTLNHLRATEVVWQACWAFVKSPKTFLKALEPVGLVLRVDPLRAHRTLLAALAGFAIGKRCSERNIQWVHADFASAPTTAALVASTYSGIPFSFCCHAFDVLSTSTAGRATDHLLRLKSTRARIVFCANSACVQKMIKLDFDDHAEKIKLKRNGVAVPPSESSRPAKPAIVGLGALVPKKGFDLLIRAFADVRTRHSDVTLSIHGEGTERRRLQALADDLGVEVSMPGAYTHDELEEILGSATLVVVPSRVMPNGDSDGVPTVFLEALARGCPVVGTDVGGVADVIRHGETGWLAPEEDPAGLAKLISSVLDHPEEGVRVGSAGRRRVLEEFTVEATSSILLNTIGTEQS